MPDVNVRHLLFYHFFYTAAIEPRTRIIGYNNFHECTTGRKQMPLTTQPLCIPLCVPFVLVNRLNCEVLKIDLRGRHIG
jgi:hypothetical protein